MKSIKKHVRITVLQLELDRGDWMDVEGVHDITFSSGTFVMASGDKEVGNTIFIQVDVKKFDDGQRGLDHLLQTEGMAKVRIVGPKKIMYAEMQPFDIKVGDGARVTYSARLHRHRTEKRVRRG